MPAEESAAEPAASPAAQRGVHFEQLTTETEPAVVRMVARTSEREDDFAALQAAALSGKGMKKSKSLMTLVEEGGNVQVLDAKKLGRETQSKIMDRLLKEGTSDNFEMLSKIRKRLHNVGLDNPTITVRYRNLSVLAHLQVGHRTVPTLTSVVTSRLQPMVDSLHKHHKMHATDFSIIDKVSGVIKPGCYTLLLGPPGSGKTTFLRALAGYHPRGQHLKVVADELTYNGQNFHQFEVQRSAAYISQVDHHYGELTVRETFEFSARCQSSGFKRDLVEELLSREAAQGIKPDPDTDAYLRATIFGSKKNNLVVEMVIRLLGLHTCADTVVGNQMLRGVSGGQKKRVSTGEMVVGPSKALFADEISTGLDSNTTYQICKAIGNLSRVMNGTVVVGLLQPQPETFDLFDDVILLSSGKVCYHGPREGILPFFESIGFFCPERRSVPDFLQEVSTPADQPKYWSLDSGKPHKYISSTTIERRFKETSAWKAVEAELDAPFEKLPEHRGALAHRKFGNSYDHLVRANLRRFWLLAQRNKIFTIIRTLQIGLMSFMMGSAFWRISKDTVADGNLFMGTFFYSQLYMMIGGLAEMHVLVERLHNMYKQRDMQFYPGWSFALPAFLIRLPFCFLEATLWTFICYFIIGYDASSARIIMFWAIMFLQNVWSISFMQLVASVCRNDTIATNIAAAFLLVFWNTGGFVLNKVDIPPWWVGAYWASPFAYNARALAINEFTSGNWMVPNPYNPSSILGYDILHNWGLQTDYWWCWVAVGYNIGSIILNVCCFMCTTTYLGALHPPATITPEALQDLKDSRGSVSQRPSLDLESAGNTVTTLPKAAAATNVAVAGPLPGTTDAGMQVVPAGVPVEMGHVAPVLPRGPEQLTYGADDEWVHRGSFVMRASLREGFTEQTAETYRKTSAIPYEPLSMTFKDVTYSVPVPQDADRSKADIPADGIHAGQLRLLKDVNGVFRPGVLTALMGASGAGKTTLMDVLAGRKTGGIITGDVRVNGYPKEEKTFARVMGYVEQTDIHLPQTTVEEACHFSAHLRLPTTVDAKTRAAFVEEVLAVVELSRLRTAYVGVPGVSGLSVEQRKRLTMAVELVANPSIVFMDEPTSGLDARAAGIVMAAVRNTVDTGRTVVCTIHQPSIDIFEAFDELLLLKPGGRTIFAGPMGDNSQLLINYFSSILGVDSIKPRYNPANWMLEQTNPGREAALGVDFSEIYATSERAQAQAELIAKHSEPPEGAKPLSYSDQHVPNDIVQFLVNFKRFSKMQWRSPDYNVSRLGITLLVGFVFGSMFWRKGDNRTSVGGVLNIMGVLYASTLFLGIINCMSVQHLIAVQRAVMYRERAAGVYNVLPFSLAQHAVELPYLLFQSVVYAAIVYWMVWFDRDAGKFFYFLFLFFLTMCYMTFFGISTTCLTPAVAFANVVASFFFAFWNLFCGFLIPSQQLRGWVIWLYWSNPVSWSLYGLVTTQLGDFDDEYITTLTGESMTIQQFLESEFFLKNSMKGVTIPILFGFIFGFAFTSFAALKWLNFLKR